MSMSDHERSLLLTGTLDTSGVGGSPFADLDNVAVAFGAPVAEEAPEPEAPEPEVPEEKAAENSPTKPVVEPEPEPVKEPEPTPAPRKRTTAAKKTQAPKPADS